MTEGFMVWVEGQSSPKVVHAEEAKAIEEACRLAKLNIGKEARILKIVGCYKAEAIINGGGKEVVANDLAEAISGMLIYYPQPPYKSPDIDKVKIKALAALNRYRKNKDE